LGDVVTVRVLLTGAAGTCRVSVYEIDQANTVIGSVTNGATVTLNGTLQTAFCTRTLSEATARGLRIIVVRLSDSATFDIYAIWGGQGFVAQSPTEAGRDNRFYITAGQNVVWDAFHTGIEVGYEWSAAYPSHWQSSNYLELISSDANNPFSGRTLRLKTTGATGGIKVYCGEGGFKPGDEITFRALFSAAAGTGYLVVRPIDATGAITTPVTNGATETFTGSLQATSVMLTIPTGAAGVALYWLRASGSDNIDTYAIWGSVGYTTTVPALGPAPYLADGRTVADDTPVRNAALLRNWYYKRSRLRRTDTPTQAVIALMGDSWAEDSGEGHGRIAEGLAVQLQALFGDAGPGYVGVSEAAGTAYNAVMTITGTWTYQTEVDATVRGVDLYDAATSDAATPAKAVVTAVCESALIHYIKQSGGGDFRWQVDTDGWTTVHTDNATEVLATVTITGLAASSHAITIECVSGPIKILGVDLHESADGVRVHKLGNGGSRADQWVAVDATIWEAGLTALAPDLVIIILGTNDYNGNFAPTTAFRVSMQTLVTRIRAALGTAVDIMLLTPAQNGITGKVYPWARYIRALRELAEQDGTVCWLDTGRYLKPYTADGVDGWINSSHLNNIGGRVYIDEIVELLT
jgi:hypothetical protein